MDRNKQGKFVTRKRKNQLVAHKENDCFKKRVKSDDNDDTFVSSLVGRTVVELGCMAEQLWCNACNITLSLRDVENEYQKGLATILTVRCSKCLLLKKVFTSKKAASEENRKSYDLFAVNLKAALACLHSGTGHDQFIKILTTMNIKPISTETLQRSQKRIASAVLEEAKESCINAIQEEKALTEADLSETVNKMMARAQNPPDESLQLKQFWSVTKARENASDKFNTVSEIVSMVTATTNSFAALHIAGKDDGNSIFLTPAQLADMTINESFISSSGLIDFGTINLAVSFDFAWFKRGNGRCYNSKNGQGTVFGTRTKKILAYDSISTECRRCKKNKCKPDECRKNFDGSAKAMEPYAAVQLIVKNKDFKDADVRVGLLAGDDDSAVISSVQREADHSVQKASDMNHIANSFGKKLWAVKKKFKELSQKVIKYLKKAFSYAIQQNKGDVEGVSGALLNIAEHVFGNHSKCKNWCGAVKDPKSYKHKYFPGGEPLKDASLKEELKKILKIYADRAEQLAPCGSSQQNESFNHMAVTKAPKSRYYGGSASGHLRVSCAVSQKNTGESYVVNLNKKACLSPGKVTEKYTARNERAKKRKNFREALISSKRRRLNLKQKNSDSIKEKKEGFSYRSSMAVDSLPVPKPVILPKEDSLRNPAFVVVDIETIGLKLSDDIIQIAAVSGEKKFEEFMMPPKAIPSEITLLTGIEVINGEMKSLGKIVETKSPLTVATEFINFLRSFNQPVVLLGHNIKRFDSPRILRWLTKCKKVDDFYGVVHGLCDTLELIGKGEKCKKQDALAKKFLTDEKWIPIVKKSHNALVDCQILKGLLDYFKITSEDMIKNSLSFHKLSEENVIKSDLKKRQVTLSVLKPKVSANMINKMAKAGIDIKMIQDAVKKGKEAVCILLGENVGGKPRVTTTKKIINQVIEACTSDGV